MKLIEDLEQTVRIQSRILADYRYERLLLTIAKSGEIEGLTDQDIPASWIDERLRLIDMCTPNHQVKLEEAQSLLDQIQKVGAA